MPAIPPPSESTVQRIFKMWEDNATPRHSRRIGASLIGRPCDRELWYFFRWAKASNFEGRMLRLFAKGNLEETLVANDMRNIGVEWLAEDPDTGKQWEFSEIGDHFVVKLDAAARGFVESPLTWHVCEVKTANHKAFDKVVKEGVQKAKPEHYNQVMTGMGMSGMERAAYVCVCKDTDDIYFERVKFDKKEWKRIIQRAKEIIFAISPPDRINESSAWYECKYCNFNGICHGMGEVAENNCRTCKHSSAVEEGGWCCDEHKIVIDDNKQKEGCNEHSYREGMVPDEVMGIIVNLGGKVSKVTGVVESKMTVNEENLSV